MVLAAFMNKLLFFDCFRDTSSVELHLQAFVKVFFFNRNPSEMNLLQHKE